MVVGDSKTGAIKTFNTFYFPLRLYLTGKMRFMPVSRSLRINVVPVDYVAKAVTQLTFEPKAEGKTFHVVAPYESLPKLGELMDFVQKWAKTELACKLPSPILSANVHFVNENNPEASTRIHRRPPSLRCTYLSCHHTSAKTANSTETISTASWTLRL